MSAFVVEDKVINSVISALAMHRVYGAFAFHDTVKRETGCNLQDSKDCAKLADSMFKLNCEAVEQRYGVGQAAEFHPLDFAYRAEMPPTLIQAYKSLGCWLYQCAEGNVPDESLLYAAMTKVYGEMAHEIVRNLPAYEKARW